MRETASGKVYRIAIDEESNRLFLYLFGEVMNASEVANVTKEVKEALGQLKPGFTALGDMTGVTLFGLPDLAEDVAVTLFEAGVSKVARVWSRETFAKLVIDSQAEKVSGGDYDKKRRQFDNLEDATAWLDSK